VNRNSVGRSSRAVSACLIAALGIGAPLKAAEDAGLRLASQPVTARSVGMAAQVGITLKLGSRQTVRDRDRLALGFNAGPRMSGAKGRPLNTGMLSLTTSPGYDVRLKMFGQDVQTFETRLGASDTDKREETEEERRARKEKGPNALGWIGIGLGAFVGLVGVAALICTDNDANCLNSD
jgi:hypothetical protein